MDSTRAGPAGSRGGGGGGDEGDQPPFDFDNKNLKSRTLSMPSSSAGCDGPFCSRK